MSTPGCLAPVLRKEEAKQLDVPQPHLIKEYYATLKLQPWVSLVENVGSSFEKIDNSTIQYLIR